VIKWEIRVLLTHFQSGQLRELLAQHAGGCDVPAEQPIDQERQLMLSPFGGQFTAREEW
jgi:hypothetical protein